MSDKLTQMATLRHKIKMCKRCPGLNVPGVTESAPGYGSGDSPIVIIGQSLCRPCMKTQIPFTGGSGRIIDQSLQLIGLPKHKLFFTNVVHCHPPDNRVSKPQEIANCVEHLQIELQIIQPKLIITLGKDASQWIDKYYPNKCTLHVGSLNKEHISSEKVGVINIPHPSFILRQSIQKRQDYIVALANAMQWGFSSE